MKEDEFGAWPKTIGELCEYVAELESQKHDYNTIADALTKATVAMFNYFACKNGMTGFQSGWSALQFLGVVRHIDGPFGIVEGEKFLYPQYDPLKEVEEWHEKWKPTLGTTAKKLLSERTPYAHPDVVQRWNEYAKYAPNEEV